MVVESHHIVAPLHTVTMYPVADTFAIALGICVAIWLVAVLLFLHRSGLWDWF